MTRHAPVVWVIMAGGGGERLWPLVRASHPKVCLTADGRRTLLGATLARLPRGTNSQHVLIVTTRAQAPHLRRTLPARFHRCVLAEPSGRNTAACIALAAAIVARRSPQALMVVLPADHWIHPTAGFRRTVQAALQVAADTRQVVTIGVRPTRPHPGLGYLCAAGALGVRHGCRTFRLGRFVEKPSAARARRLLRQRGTYWNAGMFIAPAATFQALTRRYLPAHAQRLERLAAHADARNFPTNAAATYRRLPAVSFDRGVMARGVAGVVVEAAFTWEDLGSWESLARALKTSSRELTVQSANVQIVSTNGHLVAAVGMRDTMIIHTPDATLVCHAKSSQAVRELVAGLKRDARLARYL